MVNRLIENLRTCVQADSPNDSEIRQILEQIEQESLSPEQEQDTATILWTLRTYHSNGKEPANQEKQFLADIYNLAEKGRLTIPAIRQIAQTHPEQVAKKLETAEYLCYARVPGYIDRQNSSALDWRNLQKRVFLKQKGAPAFGSRQELDQHINEFNSKYSKAKADDKKPVYTRVSEPFSVSVIDPSEEYLEETRKNQECLETYKTDPSNYTIVTLEKVDELGQGSRLRIAKIEESLDKELRRTK